MSQYSETVARVTRFNLYLRQLAVQADEIAKLYSDVGLGAETDANKAQAVTDAGLDLGATDAVVAAQLASMVNLVDAIGDLAGNRAVTQADWLSTMNKADVSGMTVSKITL